MNTNILIVDDDPGAIRLMSSILKGVGHVRFATNGAEALRLAGELAPDLVLLDAEMPGMSGFRVCEALKADPTLAAAPVIFVTSHSEAEFEIAGFEIGASDFITKPVSPPLLLTRVKAQLRVKRLEDELRRISTVDALTGVANRRRFDELLAQEWRRGLRAGEPIALMIFDVDHFKLFNDHYGHPAGDDCLRSLAQAVAGVCHRPADLVARYGGEEFVVLMPNTPRDGAQRMAQRVLDAIEALARPHAASPTSDHVTVSAGVAFYDDASDCWVGPSPDLQFDTTLQTGCVAVDLVQAADEALYAAKQGGRAQARLHDVANAGEPSLAWELAPAMPARRLA